MCSVVVCDSWRRSALRFNLPEDPERRLEWVEFLFEVNGQRLKESSWTDINICSEHFTDGCFKNLTPGTVQLKCSAVPSLCVKSEREEPHVEPVETAHAQCDDINTCSYLKTSKHTSTGSKASPKSSGVSESHSPGVSNTVASGSDQMQQEVRIDLNKEKTALLHMKGKFAANESCLLRLFRRKCPSCGCKLQMEKVTCGVLIVLNQKCLQCDYRYQWKSQVNANVSVAEDQNTAGGKEDQQEIPTDDNASCTVFSEIVTLSDEDSVPSDEGEDDGRVSSDGEWNPTEDILMAEELRMWSEEETADEEEETDSPGGLKINELCTECGCFFYILKPHTCEHKIKPYCCNICGKRCVTEMSLKAHSKTHDETFEHPCKYCHATFKTRVDKRRHEQTHQHRKDPYKCPDCSETFATSKERSIHLANHRATREFTCGVCGIEFKDIHHLRRHSYVHTGLKPYTCSVCQRGFSQTSHLKSHMRLHTGERPYKCQQCDKCFNHNVSLKSHVQRCHTSSSRHAWKKEKETASDAAGNGKTKGREQQDTDEEAHKERTDVPKSKKRRTGRPRGRPKRNAAGSLVLAEVRKGRRSNAKTGISKVRTLRKTSSRDGESEDEQSDSDISFDSAAEEEETTRKSRGRPKSDSDSDFDPDTETKKKRCSSQSSGKSSGKSRGRSKNVMA